MSLTYSVNGSALVYVGTGTAGALELLGYTDNGVDMNVQENKGEIMTDLLGPMTPQDFQDFGMTGRIVAPLIAYDPDVFAGIQNRGDANTPGLLNTPGLILGTDYGFSVGIAAPFASPWFFNKALVRPGYGAKLAVKANVTRVEFYAWPWIAVDDINPTGTVLFTRSGVP